MFQNQFPFYFFSIHKLQIYNYNFYFFAIFFISAKTVAATICLPHSTSCPPIGFGRSPATPGERHRPGSASRPTRMQRIHRVESRHRHYRHLASCCSRRGCRGQAAARIATTTSRPCLSCPGSGSPGRAPGSSAPPGRRPWGRRKPPGFARSGGASTGTASRP